MPQGEEEKSPAEEEEEITLETIYNLLIGMQGQIAEVKEDVKTIKDAIPETSILPKNSKSAVVWSKDKPEHEWNNTAKPLGMYSSESTTTTDTASDDDTIGSIADL